MDTRLQDDKQALLMADFADTLFQQNGLSQNIYRISDIPLQKAGIDMIMETPKGPIYIDEKTAIRQRNKFLNTYSLELASSNNMNGNGWFTSPNSKTTHYAFTWFRSDQEIQTITSYETAIVSKDAIKQMLIDDGINPETIKDEFLGYLDMYHRGQTFPEGIIIREKTDEYGNPKAYEWRVGDYKLVQSVHLKEQPINIVVPRDKLTRLAEYSFGFEGPVQVDVMMRQAREKKTPDFPALSENKIKQIAREDRVPNELTFANEFGSRKTGKIRNAHDGDYLCIGDNPKDSHARVATYSEKLDRWLVTHPQFPVKNSPKFIDAETYFKTELQKGNVPELFSVVDKEHNPIEISRLKNPQDGDMIHTGAMLNGQRVTLTYIKAMDAYSLSNNTVIQPQDIKTFMGKKVVDDKVLQLQRAVGNRIASELYTTFKAEGLKYKKATEQELIDRLPKILQNVQHAKWTSNRYSDLEALFQKTSEEERKSLFAPLSNPKLIADLAHELSQMNPDERQLPINVSSVIYNEERQTRYREEAQAEMRRQATAMAYKTKPVELETIAKTTEGVKTFWAHDYRTGASNKRVSWTPHTVEETIKCLKESHAPDKPIVISGLTPMWAAAAVTSQLENPVYMKTGTYCVPVHDIPQVKADMVYNREKDVFQCEHDSQGITFKIEQGRSAIAIDLTLTDPIKQRYFNEINMEKLTIPRLPVEPGQDIYITGKCHPVVFAAVAETGLKMGCNVFLENKYERGFTCAASLDKNMIGTFHTQNDKNISFEHANAQALRRGEQFITQTPHRTHRSETEFELVR